MPPSPICGLMRSVRPTSLRSIVWNGLTAPLPPVFEYEPVRNGTFWPTTIFASSLSSMTMLGVASTLASVLVSRKRASAPMFQRSPIFFSRPMFSPGGMRDGRQARAALVGGDGQVDDVRVAVVGAAGDDRAAVLVARHALPLDADVGRLLGIDLDDQRLDVDLGAPRVELVDDVAQLLVQRQAGGDDQRVGRRVGLDEAAGGRARRRA